MLILGSPQWLIPAGILLAVGVVLTWRSYRRCGWSGGWKAVALAAKLLALTLVAIFLVEPLWSRDKPRPGANLFLVAIDTSRSLEVGDQGHAVNRAGELEQLLTAGETTWLARLRQDYDVRTYLFDSRLRAADELTQLKFDGTATTLYGTLRTLAERYRQRDNVAGLLVLTDGIVTDLPATAESANPSEHLPPLYPVLIGTDRPQADLAIRRVQVSQTVFEDLPVTVQADVAQSGFAGRRVVVQLTDEQGRIVQQQEQTVADDGTLPAVRFQFRPAVEGLAFYQLRIYESGSPLARAEAVKAVEKTPPATGSAEDSAPASPASSAAATAANESAASSSRSADALLVEATTANNRQWITVQRPAGPFRVLYVSGRPNWDYKFLRRAVEDDPLVQLVGQIRIARREARFDYRGRGGQATNSLFRGFDANLEETEQYDQPVLVRMGTKDEAELRDGFPKTAAELFAYDALILDDLEAEFFTREQMELVARFVGQRGGGLLMSGGQESFQQGQYQRTPIGELLPIYLDRPQAEVAGNDSATPPSGANSPLSTIGRGDAGPEQEFRLGLSREGWLQPWVRLRRVETEETSRLTEMPGFLTLNRVGSMKPGASWLVTAEADRQTIGPALVAQRFGQGRVAAWLVGDSWRWQMRQDGPHDDLEKWWRQVVRWLASDVPRRVELTTATDGATPGNLQRLEVRVRNPAFEPLDAAGVALSIALPSGEKIPLSVEPSLAEPGLFTALCATREAGIYRATAAVEDEGGKSLGQVVAGWTSEPDAAEFGTLVANRPWLEDLARTSGGQMVLPEGLESFVRQLEFRPAPVTQQQIDPLWHQPFWLLLALAALAVEWGLRRWKGLA